MSGHLIREANVAVVGVGGLGCPAALGLATGGVGTITLIDPDRVELSNLPRQILYGDSDIGRSKVAAAGAVLRRLHPRTAIVEHPLELTADNADAVLTGAHFILDATDGVATKLLINDLAVRAGHAFCHAGVVGFRGQLLTVIPGQTACVRCVFSDVASEDQSGACSVAGVVGPIAGLIGALQASHALAYLTGACEVAGRLVTFDGLTDRWIEVDTGRLQRCEHCATDNPASAELAPPAAPG